MKATLSATAAVACKTMGWKRSIKGAYKTTGFFVNGNHWKSKVAFIGVAAIGLYYGYQVLKSMYATPKDNISVQDQ